MHASAVPVLARQLRLDGGPVGDAFVTTRQESAVAALTKPQEVHGPPAYFTPDW